MPRFLLAVAVVLAAVAPARAQQPAASKSSPTLDYEYFKVRVQPMFTTKRAGNEVDEDAFHVRPPVKNLSLKILSGVPGLVEALRQRHVIQSDSFNRK